MMGTDDRNELEVLRLRVRLLEEGARARDAIISRVAADLHRGPIADLGDRLRLLELIAQLSPELMPQRTTPAPRTTPG